MIIRGQAALAPLALPVPEYLFLPHEKNSCPARKPSLLAAALFFPQMPNLTPEVSAVMLFPAFQEILPSFSALFVVLPR
jgi:hypothetical protein